MLTSKILFSKESDFKIFIMSILKTVHLFNMIRCISDLRVHYEEWKKCRVWIGKEIKY